MSSALIIEENVGSAEHDEIAYLEKSVQRRLNGRVRELRLLVLPIGLILQGRASTYYAKQLAQHAVMAIATIPILANDIEVCPAHTDSLQLD